MPYKLFETERLDLFGWDGNSFPVICTQDETGKIHIPNAEQWRTSNYLCGEIRQLLYGQKKRYYNFQRPNLVRYARLDPIVANAW